MDSHQCSICSKNFTNRCNLLRHIREVHGASPKFKCNICAKPFQRQSRLQIHLLSHSGVRQQPQPQLTQPAAKKPRLSPANVTFVEKNVSRFRRVQCFTMNSSTQFSDLWTLFKQSQAALRETLTSSLSQLGMIKFDLILHVCFHKATDSDETISCYFHSRTLRVTTPRQLSSIILDAFKGLNKQVEDYLERGSGWVVESIDQLDVHVSKYKPIRGSTYLPLPDKLRNRQAIINVRNADNQCFKWAILSALHPVPRANKPQDLYHYTRFESELNFSNFDFPVTLDDIPLFEATNCLAINVYGYTDEDEQIKVLHLTENPDSPNQISLLLYNNQHYCWVKDIERLLRADNGNHRQFQCHRCLCMFYSAEKRDKHMDKCKNPDLDTIEMPEDVVFKFRNFHKMQRMPFAIYADFECLLEKLDNCLPNPQTSHTTAYQRHTPCGYGAAEVFGCCSNKVKLGETKVYRGPDAVQAFFNQVIAWGERYQDIYTNQTSIVMSQQDRLEFNGTSVCNICKSSLNNDRVADHCHFCGVYRGACHSRCNIGYRLSRDVVVVLHNLRRYDGHLLWQQLGTIASQQKGVEINVIPKGFDDYLTFSVRLRYNNISWHLKFIDSYQFLSTSLAKLVDNLQDKGADKFELLSTHFTDSQQRSLLLRKGVYPYEYMDGWSRFDEKKLPSRDQFASSLSGEDISEDDYTHAINVWKQFEMQSLGQYHDLYLLTDVLLLADVFENFRSFCLYKYQLDPAHYFTAPSFSWDACLKYTKVEMELLSDPDMYCFMEEGIRGGISIITHRFARANNDMLPDFDPSLPTSYIMYWDCNNLYGNSMIFALPLKDFQWIDPAQLPDIMTVADDGDTGYILEVDLDYPAGLHDAHNSYPLAAERLQVTGNMLSPYCVQLKEMLAVSNTNVEKLIPNLSRKQNYIIHYRNLKLYLSLGLKVTKIHRVVAFKQQTWMAPYIQFNTEMRKKARSSFEKDLFKLFNNAVFGKTMENVRKYIDIMLVVNEDKVVKLASKLEYNGFKILADSLWAVKMKRSTVQLNKPIYVGFTVLDLSKWIMYNFHYNYVLPKYGVNARLLFTDTDSLCYHITTNNVYADMYEDREQFDFSDYPKDHFCFSVENKKVMGKFKDELNGTPVWEFVGLRAKMYSLLDATGSEKKRAKGIKKAVVAHQVKHQMYKDVLFNSSSLKHSMNFIRADASLITTVVQNKTSLSAYDDKRFIFSDAFSSLAYGHCSIHRSALVEQS